MGTLIVKYRNKELQEANNGVCQEPSVPRMSGIVTRKWRHALVVILPRTEAMHSPTPAAITSSLMVTYKAARPFRLGIFILLTAQGSRHFSVSQKEGRGMPPAVPSGGERLHIPSLTFLPDNFKERILCLWLVWVLFLFLFFKSLISTLPLPS